MTELSEGIIPSFAIKFLISHNRSENLFAMPSMTGLDETGKPSWDFFHRPLGNRVERLPDDGCSRESLEQKMLSGNNSHPYATSVMFPATHDTSDYLNPQKIEPQMIDPERND